MKDNVQLDRRQMKILANSSFFAARSIASLHKMLKMKEMHEWIWLFAASRLL